MASWWKSYGTILLRGGDYYPANLTEAYELLLNYKMSHSKLSSRLMDDPEEVSFGNVGGDKGGRFNKDKRVSGGRGQKSVVLLLQITWPHSKRMTKPKGISSRRRRRRKEEEVEVNLNVQEEDVDDYDDVGNLLFLRAMILQKGAR